ncbi:GFA family protein [Aspergillus undulatus]|uniref:GFA family protein n=1 Tax=Aspergillus undulatus TaxID=1810928 RepID=UPI003CCDCA33
MAVGSCFCGRITVEYTSPPLISGLCHCADCRKLTSALFSYSFIIKTADLKITGTPKETTKGSDSGNVIKNYFCPDCGTQLYGHSIHPSTGIPGETTVVRAGIFDISILDQHKPAAEIYTSGRVSWMCPLEGAKQFAGMLPGAG